MLAGMEVLPCCGNKKTKKTYKVRTGFVRRHPFKPGWEIRKCFNCNQEWAVDSRKFVA